MNNWEDIYRRGKQLNKYPQDAVVSLVIRLKRHKPRLRVLELGCGAGNNLIFMAQENVDAYGIDISPSALKVAKNRLNRLNLNASLFEGCFTELPWESNFFDLVIDRSSLNCTPRNKIEKSILEAKRVLAPNGTMFSQIYSCAHPAFERALESSDGFVHQFSKEDASDINGLYFASKKDVEELFSPFTKVQLSHNLSLDQRDVITYAHWSVIADKGMEGCG